METPTISKKQAKKTLSVKKQKKETIKNVLEKPYQSYWPCLTPKHNNQLKEILENLLPRLKNPKINISYKNIANIPKEERKKYRETYLKQPPIEINEEERQSLVFGVNDTTKLLEKNEAMSVLIASDAQPRLLVQHVIDQAILYNVPLLVVEGLRDILKNKCGIASAVFALKKTLKVNNSLSLIYQTICNICEHYPVPETHITYGRRVEDITTITISDVDSVDNNKDSVMIVSDSEEEEKNEEKIYHLRKKSTNERAFIPEKSQKIDEKPVIISLDDSVINLAPSPLVKNGSIKKKQNYRPLVVKRLKGDKNRHKRTMEKFKKKNK